MSVSNIRIASASVTSACYIIVPIFAFASVSTAAIQIVHYFAHPPRHLIASHSQQMIHIRICNSEVWCTRVACLVNNAAYTFCVHVYVFAHSANPIFIQSSNNVCEGVLSHILLTSDASANYSSSRPRVNSANNIVHSHVLSQQTQAVRDCHSARDSKLRRTSTQCNCRLHLVCIHREWRQYAQGQCRSSGCVSSMLLLIAMD